MIKKFGKSLTVVKRKRTLILKTSFVFLLSCLLAGCGEKYTKQGHLLSQKIHENLVSRGVCSTKDCSAEYEIYGEDGFQVHFDIYNPKSRKALAALIEFVIENGIQITDGIPISISVYPKPRSEYGNFIINPKEIIKIEVTK